MSPILFLIYIRDLFESTIIKPLSYMDDIALIASDKILEREAEKLAAIDSDLSTGFTAIQAHAKANGYAFMRRDTRPHRALFVCDREGRYRPKWKQTDAHSTRKRLNTGSKKSVFI